MSSIYANKNKTTIQAIDRGYIKEHYGIDPKICHECGGNIKFSKQYIPNKYIFENSLHDIFLIFHIKCKKIYQARLIEEEEEE